MRLEAGLSLHYSMSLLARGSPDSCAVLTTVSSPSLFLWPKGWRREAAWESETVHRGCCSLLSQRVVWLCLGGVWFCLEDLILLTLRLWISLFMWTFFFNFKRSFFFFSSSCRREVESPLLKAFISRWRSWGPRRQSDLLQSPRWLLFIGFYFPLEWTGISWT